MKKIRIALIQAAAGADPARNLARAQKRIEEAARRGARIACLQELFRTPYFCQSEKTRNFGLAEEVPGPTTRAMSDLARRHGIALIVPVFEKRARGLYHNSAAVIDADGTLAGKYRKMHIPDDPHYYEKYYFAPGDLGFRAFETRPAKLGVLICWDQWYPEAARLSALDGAEILFYPTAIGSIGPGNSPAWKAARAAWCTVQISHAITNGVFVASVNRVGREGKLSFWGSSFVAGPDGRILAEASASKEQTLYADCDLDQIQRIRQEWPFLRDRRIDAYQAITSRFRDAKR